MFFLAPDTPAGQKKKDSERVSDKLSKTSAAKGGKSKVVKTDGHLSLFISEFKVVLNVHL